MPFAAIQRPISSSTAGFVSGRHLALHEDPLGPLVRAVALLLDVDRVVADVHRHDLAERVAVGRHARFVLAPDVVILRRERVAIHRHARGAADGADEREPRERGALLLIVLERQVAQPVVLPPRGLVLAPMPFEQVRHEPTRVLLSAALGLVHGHAGDERQHHALRFLGRRRDPLVRLARS